MRKDDLIKEAFKNYCIADKTKLDTAINYFENALVLEPNSIELLSYLSNVNRFAGNNEQANYYYDKIAEIDSKHILGLYCKATLLRSQGYEDKAKKVYQEIANSEGETLKSAYELHAYATANHFLSNFEVAEKYYIKSIKNYDFHLLAQDGLGTLYCDQGKYQESLELLEPIMMYWDKDFQLMINIALNYYHLEKYEEAREYFLQAHNVLNDLGENFNYYYELGVACKSLELYDEALNCFYEIIDKSPGELYARLAIASVYREMGEDKRALKISKALILDIKNPKIDKSKYSQEKLQDLEYRVTLLEAKIDLKDHKKVTSHHDIIERAHLAEDADFRTKKDYVVNDPDLRKYFVSFQAASDLMYDDIKILLNKNVQKKSGGAPLMDLAKSASEYIPLDLAKSMLNFVLLPFKGFNSLKSSNKAKTMVINTGYEKWFKEVLEKTAVDLAIKQEDLIHNARAQEKNSIFQSVSNFKKKFVVELYDNPQKALAYEDACKLMRILLLKNIDTSSQEAHVDECVNAVMQFELLDARYTKSFYEKMLGKVGHEREDFTPGVPVKTSLFGKVAKVVKKVIKSDKLEYVEPAVHAGEAIYKLHNNESDALCTIQKLIDVAGNVFDGFDH
ncbi:MAG: tetratricopeptide repeat protein [Rickettsiaceae bacterium]|jgi:tetratricopeptide (TPR) repeat protein|nr:tetratricopeptide repeat protein [Rickettsiaceae bacterium]